MTPNMALQPTLYGVPPLAADLYVSWLEIGVSQMSGNKLMILKLKLTIETDNRGTIGVFPGVMFL